MSPVYPTLPRLAVKDSFDDEDLSDVDDEVFIRDGRNGGMKLDDEGGVKRPLMAPRRKCKTNRSTDKRRITCRALIAPCCYGSIALLVLMGLITLVIFAVSVFPVPLTFFKNWLAKTMQDKARSVEIAPCTSLAASVVWTKSLPKLTSEAPLRSADVNGDGVEDIIIAYSTGLNHVDTPRYVCNVYFQGQTPCLGGILALDGTTGDTLWTHWTWHVIFSLDCAVDLNNDRIKDCVASGRGGALFAISGKDGATIWSLPSLDPERSGLRRVLDVSDAIYVSDLDGDKVGDVIAAHTVQIDAKRSSDLVIISGKSGRVIHSVSMNNEVELYIAPQIIVQPDGEKILVLVTGSHEKSGGLYVAELSSILHGDIKLRELFHDSEKGILSQPILADVTEDGTEDIIAAMFNSVIVAYNGRTYEQIWNYTVPNSEITSSPIPGYYNDDDVPDFMVKHQVGPGFPVYYYTVATILDGKTGKPLLEKELEDSLSGQMSGLSVTVDGYGNDWFLHWSADCLNHEGDRSPYQFLKTTSLSSQTGADLCKLRFNSTLSTKLLALSQHTAPPGQPLYISDEWTKLEYNSSIDPRKEAEKYSETHPDYEGLNPEPGVASITERSLRVHSNRHGRPSGSRDNENDIFSEQTNFSGFKERKDNLRDNNLETNVSDDFGSNEDWRDTNKWEDDKDYNALYDDGDVVVDKVNGIREQRSELIDDDKKVDNYVNEVKNELSDSNMDYTNGQNEDKNYGSSTLVNRTKNLESNFSHPSELSDFDFDENVNEEIDARVKQKRNITEDWKRWDEINVDGTRIAKTNESFFKIAEKLSSDLEVKKRENATNETRPSVTQKSVLNISIDDANETQDASERLKLAGNKTDEGKFLKDKTLDEKITTWRTRDIFSKMTRDNEEDENIEKIFKRESMKNRQSFTKNRINVEKGNKAKREANTVDSQTENLEGVQRQPPTGILLPSLTKVGKLSNSVDLIFSTSWLPASDASVILLRQDLDCIRRKRKESEASNVRNKKNQQQRSQFVLECLAERGVDYKLLQESTDRENVKIPLGQMTVYRMKLECVCPDDMLKGQTCRSISSQQSWPEHLGPLTNGYFKPLEKPAS